VTPRLFFGAGVPFGVSEKAVADAVEDAGLLGDVPETGFFDFEMEDGVVHI
jgi:hypothetical protein